jgi:hypothetical protein
MKPEEIIHKQICLYLRKQYPDVIFTSEPSGLRLPIGLAVKLSKLRSGAKLPDLWIMEPKANYGGLFIELKAEGILKKNWEYKTPHIKAQAETIKRLIDKGYYASFAVGFEDAKNIIDDYLNQKL